jgi:hypothetical protein
VPVNPLVGLRSYHINQLVYGAGFDERARKGAAELLARLYEVFVAADCLLVEVNPLVLTADGQVSALDGKVTLDDSALDRHPDLEELRDTFAVDPQEQAAKEKGLNYIKLDGYVGIIGNGAGLVMSTLDVVAQAGGKAANFLDVGGGASAETMAAGLEVILSDPKVRSVLVNIFGGITRGDLVAQGILDALDRLGDKVQVPLVVRLDGTNAEEGRALLAGSPSDRSSRQPPCSTPPARRSSWPTRRQVPEPWPSSVDSRTRLVVQGLTGREGRFHALRNRDYGTTWSPGSPRARPARTSRASRCSTPSPRPWPRPGPTPRSSSCPPASPSTPSTRPPTPASRWSC